MATLKSYPCYECVCVWCIGMYVCKKKCVCVCVENRFLCVLILNPSGSMTACMCTLHVARECMCWNLDFQWHHPPFPVNACNLHYKALGHGRSCSDPFSVPLLGLFYVYNDIGFLNFKPECFWRGESTWKTSFEKGTFVQREANHLQLQK